MSELERIVEMTPAYDHTDKRGGVHGVNLGMTVRGDKGAVRLVITTNWMLPQVQKRMDAHILMKATRGSSFTDQIADPIVPEEKEGFSDVNRLMEMANRHMGRDNGGVLDPIDLEVVYHPQPMDVWYHSLTPMREDQEPSREACEYLDGRPCYCDGNSGQAKTAFQILVAEGSDSVWKYLEERYDATFDEAVRVHINY